MGFKSRHARKNIFGLFTLNVWKHMKIMKTSSFPGSVKRKLFCAGDIQNGFHIFERSKFITMRSFPLIMFHLLKWYLMN